MIVHLMPIGTDIHHAYTALKAKNYGFDKVYLIIGKIRKNETNQEFKNKYKQAKDNAKELKDFIEQAHAQAEIIEIPAFEDNSLQLLLDQYREIIRNEIKNGSEVFVNITGGTNLMASAALIASLFYHAKAYYVLRSEFTPGNLIQELPLPRVAYTLQEAKEDIIRLLYQEEGHKVNKKSDLLNKKIKGKNGKEREFKSIQAINPHLQALEEMKFIEIKEEGRNQSVALTQSGEMVAKDLQ